MGMCLSNPIICVALEDLKEELIIDIKKELIKVVIPDIILFLQQTENNLSEINLNNNLII